MPTISIVIPCYNYAHFLPETINSCLAQTYIDFEIIIVNDGSTDNTREVAEAFAQKDRRIRCIHQENKGLSASRNAGWKAAQGKYLQFLDADDILLPQKLERCIEVIEKEPENTVVYTLYQNRTADLSNVHPRIPKPPPHGELHPIEAFAQKTRFPPHSPLIPYHLMEVTGGFCEELTAAEDWYMWVNLALRGVRFVGVNEMLVLYRIHPTSMSADRLFTEQERLKAINMLDQLPLIKGMLNQRLLLSDSLYRLSQIYIERSNFGEAAKYLLKSVVTHPRKRHIQWILSSFKIYLTRSDGIRRLWQRQTTGLI